MPPPPVLQRIPGQDHAIAFLAGAVPRPHHAYVLAGPEGSGKSLAARAFAAALLCARGGCGECRDCRLALADRHPNGFVVEPEGRDIHVDTIREEVWQPAYRTAPEPGRKVFVVREADRVLSGLDALLAPGRPAVASPLDREFRSAGRGNLPDVMGAIGNAAGLPSIAVPNGLSEARLPTSLQFMGRAWEENTILAAARAWQAITDHHGQHPPEVS